jgi:hypothetical protein
MWCFQLSTTPPRLTAYQRAAKQYRGKGTVVFVPGNHQGPPKNHHRPSVGTLVIFCYLSAFSILFKCKGGELL